MTEIIDLTKNEYNGMAHVNRIMQSKDEGRMTVRFPRTFWTFFKNDWRDQSIKQITDGHKDAESFHGRKDNVPVYNIFKYHGKESFKIGFALPRITKTDKQKLVKIQHYWDGLDHMESDETKKKSLHLQVD